MALAAAELGVRRGFNMSGFQDDDDDYCNDGVWSSSAKCCTSRFDDRCGRTTMSLGID
jgi:hypothetical protein